MSDLKQNKHEWIPSTLGHGEVMCKHCKSTNRELAAIGMLNDCDAQGERSRHRHIGYREPELSPDDSEQQAMEVLNAAQEKADEVDAD